MSTARPFFVGRLSPGAFGKVALEALEGLPIGDDAVGLDAREQHLPAAVWAGRSLGRIPGWLSDEIGHGCSFAIGGTATELSVIGRGLSYWAGTRLLEGGDAPMDVPISGGDQDGAYGDGEQPCLSATKSVIHLTPRFACGVNGYNAWVVGYGAVRDVVGIRCGAISGNMKVSFQAARSIG